jgi:hypothetical protein
MTVADCTEVGISGKWAGYVSVKCMWHDKDGNPLEKDYSADMLEKVEGATKT